MKIILSPSKTATWTTSPNLDDREPLFPNKTNTLARQLARMSKTKLQKALKLSDSLTEEVYQMYKSFFETHPVQAFPSFDGLVFKQLRREQYSKAQWDYIASNVRILDALYGVLQAGTLIAPYRLDMKASIGRNLYTYWNISDHFKDDVILNLASKEFAQMVLVPVIDVEFLQCHNGSCEAQATYSKMARGQMLDYLIEHQVTSLESVRLFNRDGYCFDPERSTTETLVFVRR